MMPARVLCLLLLPALAAGCTTGEPANPNLLAPEVIIDVLPTGETTVYVHGAFGERRYDEIVIQIDNQTVFERKHAFSAEHRLNNTSFFLDVQAAAGASRFQMQGGFDLEADEDETRVRVAFLDPQGEWSKPRDYNLPFVQILDRPEVDA